MTDERTVTTGETAALLCSQESVAALLAEIARLTRERDEARAERDDLRGALHTCLWAMRQPLDGWKGDCERKAMDKANAALAQIEQERSK